MSKIGRNEPCPCGSGEKYKRCCLNYEELRSEADNPATSLLAELRELMREREFESLEQAQEFVDEFWQKRNQEAHSGFLGFSAEQMHRMLYSALEAVGDIIEFNTALPAKVFKEIPVVQNVLLFLARLAELEPLKATAKGNLPLKFARELFSQFPQHKESLRFQIKSEIESVYVHSLRIVLVMCGWMKKRNNYFSLTVKGRKLLEEGFSSTHYFHLFKTHTRKFNWGFQDGYPELWIIQVGFLFALHLLREQATDFTDGQDLADQFIEAFPIVLTQAPRERFWGPRETVSCAFSLRFLVRFCEYFGLVEIRHEKPDPLEKRLFVKTTNFYDSFLVWKAP